MLVRFINKQLYIVYDTNSLNVTNNHNNDHYLTEINSNLQYYKFITNEYSHIKL